MPTETEIYQLLNIPLNINMIKIEYFIKGFFRSDKYCSESEQLFRKGTL